MSTGEHPEREDVIEDRALDVTVAFKIHIEQRDAGGEEAAEADHQDEPLMVYLVRPSCNSAGR